MIGPLLAASLTLVSPEADPATWRCAVAAERVPRVLSLLGRDTLPASEARAARSGIELAPGPLSRAGAIVLARSVGADVLVVLRCGEEDGQLVLEAREFLAAAPEASPPVRVGRPVADFVAAIDDLAGRLAGRSPETAGLRAPSGRALEKAGAALMKTGATERAVGLAQALVDDPTSIDLRLSVVEALLAVRDFDGAARFASQTPFAGLPKALSRAMRFRLGAALLEAARYAEARDLLRALRAESETAAILNNLGVALFRLRDPDATATFAKAAAFEDHRQRDVEFNHSLTLVFHDQPAAALPRLEAALSRDEADVRSRLLRVWALRLVNREAERDAEWDRLMRDAPAFASLSRPDPVRRLERIFFFERPAPGAAPALGEAPGRVGNITGQ